MIGFSDAVLQAGVLCSYRKAFYLFDELHRFNCELFPWALGNWVGCFWEVMCESKKRGKITLKVTRDETKLFLLC